MSSAYDDQILLFRVNNIILFYIQLKKCQLVPPWWPIGHLECTTLEPSAVIGLQNKKLAGRVRLPETLLLSFEHEVGAVTRNVLTHERTPFFESIFHSRSVRDLIERHQPSPWHCKSVHLPHFVDELILLVVQRLVARLPQYNPHQPQNSNMTGIKDERTPIAEPRAPRREDRTRMERTTKNHLDEDPLFRWQTRRVRILHPLVFTIVPVEKARSETDIAPPANLQGPVGHLHSSAKLRHPSFGHYVLRNTNKNSTIRCYWQIAF